LTSVHTGVFLIVKASIILDYLSQDDVNFIIERYTNNRKKIIKKARKKQPIIKESIVE